MRKLLPALLLPALLLPACGGNDLNQAKRSDGRQALAQAQVCPPGKFSDSELRCSVQTNPVQISVPAPEGWSVYKAGWMQQDDQSMHSSQTGFSSLIQDQPAGGCRSMVDIQVSQVSEKSMAQQHAKMLRIVQRHKNDPQAKTGWGKTTQDGSQWIWTMVVGEPVLFIVTPVQGQTLEWRLQTQSIKLDGDQLAEDICQPTGSAKAKLEMLENLLAQAKISS